MRGQTLQDLSDQLDPDTVTLEQFHQLRASAEGCDTTSATSDDSDPRSNQHPRPTEDR
jgi:hypothetical protein